MVREAEERDLDKVAELAALMWTGHSAEELRNELFEIRRGCFSGVCLLSAEI